MYTVVIVNRLQVIDLAFKRTGIVRISHDREFGLRVHADAVFQVSRLIRVKTVCLEIMIHVIFIPETKKTLICLLEVVRDSDTVTRNFHDRRVIIRISVCIRAAVRIHIIIHGLGILSHTETHNGVDFVVFVNLKYAIGVQRDHIQTVDQVTRLNRDNLGERLSAVFQNLLRADAPIHMCLKIIRDVLPV